MKPSQVLVMYRDMVSFSSKAPYRSPAPLFKIAAEEVRRLIRHCLAIGDVDMAEESWWSILARNRKLILRCRTVHNNMWFLSAGTVAGSMVMGFPLNVQTFQNEQYYTSKPMDKIYSLPVLSPTQWEPRHIAWRSPLWLRIRAGRWYKENHLFVMHPVCETDTLIKIAARHAFNDIPKAGIVQIGGRFGADVSNSYSLPVNILNLAEKILGALDDDQNMAMLRFRMMDKDDLESFIRFDSLRGFPCRAEHATINKAVGAFDEAELQITSRSRLFSQSSRITARRPHRADPVQVQLVRHQRDKSRGMARRLASFLPPEPKKRRKYTKNIDIGEHVDEAHIDSLFTFSNTIYKDSLDQGWRLNSYGKRFFRSWHLHGKANAAEQFVELAWNRAVTMCYQERCSS